MFNLVRLISLPFLVASLIGLIAGVAAVFGARVLALGLSATQETIALFGFTICFGFFGLVDSVNRLVMWLRNKKR